MKKEYGLALMLALVAPTIAHAQFPVPEVPERLKELHFQLGAWNTTMRILDPAGNVVQERSGREVVTLEHGGLLILAYIYTDGREEPIMRRWQYFDLYKKRLFDVSFDLVGHFERRIESTNEGRLAFMFPEPESFQDGVFRNWRKTYSDVEENAYRVTWDHTEDGKTWTTQIVIDFARQ